ncbi:MAG TPA: glycoside hydrolase family 3 N-terminal domain-containing protein, partial [Chloroflexota bacterium]|nr:glycoside hydrolase family 3 N-terminal domain-containing protein [Chloroflexota bacterium]
MAPRTSSDLARDVGQLLIMGFDGAEPSQKLAVAMASLQPAGVILFTRNIVSAEQTYELLRACQQPVEIPMFLCVDMEGGTVDRLRDAVGPAP